MFLEQFPPGLIRLPDSDSDFGVCVSLSNDFSSDYVVLEGLSVEDCTIIQSNSSAVNPHKTKDMKDILFLGCLRH